MKTPFFRVDVSWATETSNIKYKTIQKETNYVEKSLSIIARFLHIMFMLNLGFQIASFQHIHQAIYQSSNICTHRLIVWTFSQIPSLVGFFFWKIIKNTQNRCKVAEKLQEVLTTNNFFRPRFFGNLRTSKKKSSEPLMKYVKWANKYTTQIRCIMNQASPPGSFKSNELCTYIEGNNFSICFFWTAFSNYTIIQSSRKWKK